MGGTGGGADRDTVCARICASISTLSCSGDGAACEADCAATWEPALCQAETQALLVCSSMAPASAWECDEFDEPALDEGCDAEGLAITDCVLASI